MRRIPASGSLDQNHPELLAAEPADDVGRPMSLEAVGRLGLLGDRTRDREEHLITGLDADQLVVRGEVVDVGQQDMHGPVVPLGAQELARERP